MVLVSIESSLRRCLQTLQSIDPPGGIEVLSYKRNRGVRIFRTDDGFLKIIVRGYVSETIIAEQSRVEKLLRTIFRREFPRSRKVRLYRLDSPDHSPQQRKVL